MNVTLQGHRFAKFGPPGGVCIDLCRGMCYALRHVAPLYFPRRVPSRDARATQISPLLVIFIHCRALLIGTLFTCRCGD